MQLSVTSTCYNKWYRWSDSNQKTASDRLIMPHFPSYSSELSYYLRLLSITVYWSFYWRFGSLPHSQLYRTIASIRCVFRNPLTEDIGCVSRHLARMVSTSARIHRLPSRATELRHIRKAVVQWRKLRLDNEIAWHRE